MLAAAKLQLRRVVTSIMNSCYQDKLLLVVTDLIKQIIQLIIIH